MIDWMVEVTNAFKCSDQTFFLAVNLMDRYFDSVSVNGDSKGRKSLELNELHGTGIVSMFVASKYDDVYPLLMRTVVHKISHDKMTN